MNKLFRILFTVLPLLGSQAALAAQELTGAVPADLVKLFVGRVFGPGVRLYDGVMAGFPALSLPAGAKAIGGMDYGQSQMVFIDTGGDTEAVRQALGKALTAAGWQRIENSVYGGLVGQGFVPLNLPALSNVSYCSDQRGNLSFLANRARPEVLVASFSPQRQHSPDCAMRQRIAGQGRMQGLQQYIPRLELTPEFIGKGMSLRQDGRMSSGGITQVAAHLLGADSSRGVFASFNKQLSSQGWKRQFRHAGKLQSISTWTRTVEKDRELLGTLLITHFTDGTHRLGFRLIALDGEDSGGIGSVMRVDP